MATIDEQRVVSPQRKVTRKEYAEHTTDVCGGCLDAIAPGLDAQCPTCTARSNALDPIYDAMDAMDDAREHFCVEIERATTPYRIEGFEPADVAAAREELSAAYQAVLDRVEDVLERYASPPAC